VALAHTFLEMHRGTGDTKEKLIEAIFSCWGDESDQEV
jgi:Fe-S-cluster formation regulator IscX/YfhJ